MSEFSKQLIVITGVGRKGQAGETIARAFCEAGAQVALVDLAEDQVQERAGALRELGFVATAHAGDLSDALTAERIAHDVFAAHPTAQGKVHALVNAAGGFGFTGSLDTSDPTGWRTQFTISADTAYAATRAFLPALRAARGSVVYFASAATMPGGNTAGIAAYAAAKSAVLALMQSVAQAEVDSGVRANAVAPTAIRTALNLGTMGDKDRYVDRESVADVVLFLCGHGARNVTGQAITLQ